VVRSFLIWIAASLVTATLLTGFYFVHEDMPRSIRAPTSLLLAPVAIVDGLCYALGMPGIYGKLIPVFVVNLGSSMVACLAMGWLWGRWRPRANPTSTGHA
jgi:hypothetical protein